MVTAATLLNGRRNTLTSIFLQWTPSEGTTQYFLSVVQSGVQVLTFTLPASSSFVVPSVTSGVTYNFLLFSGNAAGVDMINSANTAASTNCKPWSFIRLSRQSTNQPSFAIIAVFCDSVTGFNASWAGVAAGQLSCKWFLVVFVLFCFLVLFTAFGLPPLQMALATLALGATLSETALMLERQTVFWDL